MCEYDYLSAILHVTSARCGGPVQDPEISLHCLGYGDGPHRRGYLLLEDGQIGDGPDQGRHQHLLQL